MSRGSKIFLRYLSFAKFNFSRALNTSASGNTRPGNFGIVRSPFEVADYLKVRGVVESTDEKLEETRTRFLRTARGIAQLSAARGEYPRR